MNTGRFVLFAFCLFFLCHPVTFAQKTKSQLEKEKKENLNKIKEAEEILKQTTGQKKTSLGQLSAINQEIGARGALISSIKQEVRDLDTQIGELNIVTKLLQQDLVNLKEEYSEMIISAEKASQGMGKLAFLFSATSFNQLMMRLEYLEQYAAARKNQIIQIELVSETLSRQKTFVENKKIKKSELLQEEMQENQRLTVLKKKQGELVRALGKKESELKTELSDRKQAIARLGKLISDLIRKETLKAASNKYELTPEGKVISASFAGNKKRILWPVESGFISGKYGRQPHPVLKGIMIENPGVDIQTNKNQTVRAVFDGKVSAVASVRGMPGKVVIVQHGEYRTVYANLKDSGLKAGQFIKKKDTIGTVYTDIDGLSEVQFQVWKGGNKLNPSEWLHPR